MKKQSVVDDNEERINCLNNSDDVKYDDEVFHKSVGSETKSVTKNDNMFRKRRTVYDQVEMTCTMNGKSDKEMQTAVKSKLGNDFEKKSETMHPLFIAIYDSSLIQVESELAHLTSYDLNNMAYAGQSPLHASCQIKNIDITKLLLEKGSKVCIRNTVGNTPLHTAVSEAWKEGVIELLQNGASPNTLTDSNLKVKEVLHQTPLHVAVKQGNIPITTIMLDYNPDLKIRDSKCNSILHLAAQSHSPQLIKILLKRKDCRTVIEFGNESGNTPLHSLMESDKSVTADDHIVKCAKIFINEGIDVDSTNIYGENALYMACKSNFPGVVQYLLNVGASPTVLTRGESSTLHACCRSGSNTSLKHLLNTGCVSDLILREDSEGLSPIHIAINSYSIDCCELLLNNGENLTYTDSNGVSRCTLIMLNLPNASELLNRLFDANTKISSKHVHDPAFSVVFDYSVLFNTSSYCYLQNSIICELMRAPRFSSHLKHPLIESFLFIKWGRIKPFFYLGVLNYFLLLLTHTIFVMKSYGGVNYTDWSLEENYPTLLAVRVVYAVLLFIVIVPEIVLFASQVKKAFCQFETYTKLVTLATASFIIFSSIQDYNAVLKRNVAAVSILSGWVELMFLLGRFPTFGVYILMFITISKSIFKFLIAFSFILVGYACAFEILFYEMDTFKTLPLTMLKTIMMMVGEIEYGDLYEQGNFTRLFEKHDESFHVYINDFLRFMLLTSFLFLVPILIANLLIGLAVNDLPDLQRRGKIGRLAKQASYIVSYENLMFFFRRHFCFPQYMRKALIDHYKICSEVMFYPNKSNHSTKRGLQIPSETLREAIVVGAKVDELKDLCTIQDSIETQFYTFQKQYTRDRKVAENQLSELSKISKNNVKNESDIHKLLIDMQKELQEQRSLLNKYILHRKF